LSYLLALPILKILTPATEHPARRNILMILAHFVWGATLGLVVALV
jgi:putative membrane protein